jgi:hypothetical protein
MSFFYWNVNRWRSCLQNVSYVFFQNDGFQLWQPISSCLLYAHLFNMFLYSFGSALEFWEVKVFLFYISCGLGAALMHTGINYYYFNDAINTLAVVFSRLSSSV